MTFDELRENFLKNNSAVRRKSWPEGEYWKFDSISGLVIKYQADKPVGFVGAFRWVDNTIEPDDWEVA